MKSSSQIKLTVAVNPHLGTSGVHVSDIDIDVIQRLAELSNVRFEAPLSLEDRLLTHYLTANFTHILFGNCEAKKLVMSSNIYALEMHLTLSDHLFSVSINDNDVLELPIEVRNMIGEIFTGKTDIGVNHSAGDFIDILRESVIENFSVVRIARTFCLRQNLVGAEHELSALELMIDDYMQSTGLRFINKQSFLNAVTDYLGLEQP